MADAVTSNWVWRPGVFVVSRDTPNPDGDHRVRHNFWRLPVWRKGHRVLVERDADVAALVVRSLVTGGSARVVNGRRPDPAVDRLADVLEPAPESLDTVLITSRLSARSVLLRLIEAGAVSLDHVKAVCAE